MKSRRFGRMNERLLGHVAALGVIAGYLAMSTAWAATPVWDGDTSATWSTGGNWDLGTAPGVNDTAVFSAASPLNQPTVTASTSITGLTFTVNPSITVNSGQTLTVTASNLTTGAAGVTLKGAGDLSFTATGSNLSFGSGTITLDGGGFKLTGSEVAISTTTGLPTGGGGADRTLLNNLVVTANGGRLAMNTGSGADAAAIAFNTLTLGGTLTNTSAGGGSGEGYTIAGTVTLQQDVSRTLRIACSTGHNGSDWIAGKITDGAGSAGNSLRLAANLNKGVLHIANAANDYAGGTIIETCGNAPANYVNVLSAAKLGSGNLTAQSGGRILLNNPTASGLAGNLAVSATITADAGSAVGVGANVNIANRFTASSAGVYGIDGGTAHSYALNMSTLGNGAMFLGSVAGGTYSGTSLTAGSGSTYRIGGGTPSGSLYNLVFSGANALTGNNSVRVGAGLNSNASYGRVLLDASQDFVGSVTIETDGLLATRVSAGTPFGNTANLILVYGTLGASGVNGVFNDACLANLTLLPGSTVECNNDNFGNTAGYNNADRWPDSRAVSLNGAAFRLYSARSSDSSETIGAVTFSGHSQLQSRRAANSAQDNILTTASITRQARGTLVINPAAMGNLGADSNNICERIVVTAAPTLINGGTLVEPSVVGWQLDNNGNPASASFLTYLSTSGVNVPGTLGFTSVVYTASGATALNGASALGGTGLIDQTGDITLSQNPAVYALRTSGNTTASGANTNVTIGSGTDPAGLILVGNGKTHTAIFDFGAREALIWKPTGNGDTLSGGVRTTGGLTKGGPGQITLSAAVAANQSISGGVVLNAGTLTIGSTVVANDLQDNVLTVHQDGRLSMNNYDLSVTGLAGVGRGANVYNSGASAKTLTLSVASGTNVYEGRLQASQTAANLGLTKSGAGVQVLAGVASYTGATAVNGGALWVTGSLTNSAVTVAAGATLGGTGTCYGDVTVQNGGVLAPGTNSVGTFTVGSLALNGTSTNAFDLGATNASDRVVVIGALTLDGVLNVSTQAGFAAGTYVLMTYGGALTDNGLTVNDLPGYICSLQVGGGQVRLNVDTYPEMAVFGNGVEIASGDTTPDAGDYTDFGSVQNDGVGGSYADRAFTITNTVAGRLYLTGSPIVALSGTGTGQFAVVTQPAVTNVAGFSNVTFTIRFDPVVNGTSTALVSIANTDTNENPYTFVVQGAGAAGGPEMAILGTNGSEIASGEINATEAAGTDFGSLTAGTIDRTFTVTNSGGAGLALGGSPIVAIVGANSNDFSVVDPPSTPVPAGGSDTFTVRFAPSGLGSRAATLSIANNDADENPYTFDIKGTFSGPEMDMLGTNMAEIVSGSGTPVGTDGTDFGSLAVYAASVTHTFTITNRGYASLSLTGTPVVSISGPAAADFTVPVQPAGSVSASNALSFSIVFDPSASGSRAATVSIANTDPSENPYTFAIGGAGLVPTMGVLGTNGAAIADGTATPSGAEGTDFGSIPANQTLDRTFTITNSGAATLVLTGATAVVFGGANPGDFQVAAAPSTNVAPGDATTFTVRFVPTAIGLRQATVVVGNTDPSRDPYDFAVKGTATVVVATWDGGGGADTDWGTGANWVGDVAPTFGGGEELTVTSGFGANTALTLGADRAVSRLTIGGGTTAISLGSAGQTLRLSKTDSSAAAGAALWNANTGDGKAATVNATVKLQAGAAGSYTGYFREDNNSNGGTTFNGPVQQAAGESWTLRFNQGSQRGRVTLANADNSIHEIRNDGMFAPGLYSGTPGGFGGASLTLAGGSTGTSIADHYAGAAAVGNSITLTAQSAWAPLVATRMTGSLAQGGNQLNYGAASSGGNGIPLRLEWSSISGTGVTSLRAVTVAPSSMGMFAGGTLNIGDSTAGHGTIVLSGASGNDVPTWGDFVAARTYNQSGGSGTWRNNIPAGTAADSFYAGGFAARGADLTIPHQSAGNAGGLTDTVFTRNFILGSQASIGGVRYAANAVRVETDIAYGSQTLGTQRYFGAAHNAGLSKETTQWVLVGPVHELAGVISGSNIILYPMGTSETGAGMIRISNAANSLTGTSAWILGGNRNTFTTLGGMSVTGPGNMSDLSSIVLVFTSDAAFGGATEVEVGSRTAGGAGMLLFEDTNPGGATTFARSFNLVSTTEGAGTGTASWGSYAGDVVYQGSMTLAGSLANAPVHVQSGTLTLGSGGTPATLVNNRTVATVHNKGGSGVLILQNLAFGGTQTTNDWAVYNGAIRETGNSSSNSMAGSNLKLAGGVLETCDATIGAALTRALGTVANQVQWSASGGFAAYGGALTVNIGGSATQLTWGAASFVPSGSALVFGSATADGVVTFANPINLGSSGVNAREVRVDDNASSAADRAVLAAVLSNGGGTQGFVKTGSGVLELAGGVTSTYNGATTISNGTLLVNGTLSAASTSVTVSAGATLGGTGTINRAVSLLAGSMLSPGNLGIGTLTVSNLTLAAGCTNTFELGAAADKVVVNGNVTLAGVINLSTNTGFAPGLHTLMTWTGAKTDTGIALGTTPAGYYVELQVGVSDLKVVVGNPDMGVTGNGAAVADGSVTASAGNGTDMGSVLADASPLTYVDAIFTITNSGVGRLDLTGSPVATLSGSSEFSVVAQPAATNLAGGTAVTFTVRFDPTAVASYTATVTIANSDATKNPYDFIVQGSGALGGPDMSVLGTNGVAITNGDLSASTDDGTDFGVLTGGHVDRAFTVTNSGGANLVLSGSPLISVGGANASDFSIVGLPATPVGISQATTFTVRFTPTVLGLRQAVLSITNNDTAHTPYTLALAGTFNGPEIDVLGTNMAEIVSGSGTPVGPDGTDFGSLVVYAASVTHTFTITNRGYASLSLTGTPVVSISGPAAADFTVPVQPASSVSAGAVLNFDIVFDPSTSGSRAATVSIANTDPSENPYTFAVGGAGLVPVMGVLGTNGATIADGTATPSGAEGTDFGSTQANLTVDRTFTITNSGNAALVLTGATAVVFGGANPGDFQVTSAPSTNVAPGGTTTFTVRFAPTATGVRQATVVIGNTDPSRDPYDFAMRGTATVAVATWDGGGLADTSWGTAANWAGDTLPSFNGAEDLDVRSGFGANTALALGADRAARRMAVGGGATSISISNNTLTLTYTNSANATGGALWNSYTANSAPLQVYSTVKLQGGATGTYTAYLREENNSGGGTYFRGPVQQATGETWRLRFDQQTSGSGLFVFGATSSTVAELRNDGTTVASETPGAFGSATLTLAGGTTGTRTVEHYSGAAAVTNAIVVTNTATWASTIATRIVGTLAQGANTLTYSGGQLTRLEYAGISGSGATVLYSGPVAPTSMSQFAGGTLSLGDPGAAGKGVLVLSGGAGYGVPTWDEFRTARAFNQSGGAGTWRINTTPGQSDNSGPAGGFAARGADLVIPHQSAANAGGITSTTFTRNFALGTSASVGGTRYATNAVIVNTDIAFGNGSGSNRYIQVANNAGLAKSSTEWTLAGAIHELNGAITGTDVVIMPLCNATAAAGMVRVSNPANSLGGASRWILGATRGAFTTMDGGSVLNPANAADMSSIVMIFTCDGAFGGAAEVQVASQASSGSQPSSMLLLEDTNALGSTTFGRNINLLDSNESEGAAGWGSYGGEVVYQGTLTTTGTVGNLPIHVESGTLTLGSVGIPAALVNNRTATTVHNKGGSGVLILQNLLLGGTQTTNNWAVYNGVLRETGNTSANSTAGSNLRLAGGVLETSGTALGGSFVRALGTGAGQVQWTTGGGGFAAYGGALTVNIGGAAASYTWASTASFLTANNPLIFGSQTADNSITFQNGIGLNNAVREIRVYDNTNSTADKAVIGGVLSGTGSSGLLKTGAGTLELAAGVTHTYAGTTAVSNGTLLVNGTLSSQTSTVMVYSAATLGGTGTINRAVTVLGGGRLETGVNGAGTLTVSNVTVAAGAQSVFHLDGAYNRLAINGNMSLAGSLVLTNAVGLPNGTYDIITYTGTLTTNGMSLVTSAPVGTHVELLTSTPNTLRVLVYDSLGTVFKFR